MNPSPFSSRQALPDDPGHPRRGHDVSTPFIPIAVYMAVAIVLSIVRRTSRFGAGMLIGMGVFILLDGLCLGILARGGA